MMTSFWLDAARDGFSQKRVAYFGVTFDAKMSGVSSAEFVKRRRGRPHQIKHGLPSMAMAKPTNQRAGTAISTMAMKRRGNFLGQ